MQTASVSQILLSAEVQRSIPGERFFAAVFLSSSLCPFLLTIDIMQMIACKRDYNPSEINYPFSVQYSASVVHCVHSDLFLLLLFFALGP